MKLRSPSFTGDAAQGEIIQHFPANLNELHQALCHQPWHSTAPRTATSNLTPKLGPGLQKKSLPIENRCLPIHSVQHFWGTKPAPGTAQKYSSSRRITPTQRRASKIPLPNCSHRTQKDISLQLLFKSNGRFAPDRLLQLLQNTSQHIHFVSGAAICFNVSILSSSQDHRANCILHKVALLTQKLGHLTSLFPNNDRKWGKSSAQTSDSQLVQHVSEPSLVSPLTGSVSRVTQALHTNYPVIILKQLQHSSTVSSNYSDRRQTSGETNRSTWAQTRPRTQRQGTKNKTQWWAFGCTPDNLLGFFPPLMFFPIFM